MKLLRRRVRRWLCARSTRVRHARDDALDDVPAGVIAERDPVRRVPRAEHLALDRTCTPAITMARLDRADRVVRPLGLGEQQRDGIVHLSAVGIEIALGPEGRDRADHQRLAAEVLARMRVSYLHAD